MINPCMTLPNFLPGFFHLVEFKNLRWPQVVFSPKGDLTVEDAIRGAAEIIWREDGRQVAPGEVARVSGPFPVADAAIVPVTTDLLREDDE